jgi:hypothetical protein
MIGVLFCALGLTWWLEQRRVEVELLEHLQVVVPNRME